MKQNQTEEKEKRTSDLGEGGSLFGRTLQPPGASRSREYVKLNYIFIACFSLQDYSCIKKIQVYTLMLSGQEAYTVMPKQHTNKTKHPAQVHVTLIPY